MKRLRKVKPLKAIIIVLFALFVILFVVNETALFKNDKTHTFDEAFAKQMQGDALHTKSKGNQFVNASEQDVKGAMTVDRKDSDLMYMDLSEPIEMSEDEVNDMLKGKGILEGHGKAFLEAQKENDVNVIYLVSHAQLETGEGRSALAKGLRKGDARYYNFFGIGAFDREAVKTGASYAQKAGWTSPDKAIKGGASFVRTQYFENGQLNLYQMRWNPQSPATNQYASDIDWPAKIAERMEAYYQKYGIKKDDIRKDFYKK
ncbi:N-acetylglucosaminidase [Staphylococcus delphini]|uniref:N-acetylglucosaminidase n=1 Tax=Staphylococcus delphini TaxID=53344 RepID=A0AAQ0D879_9STAP|nr:N-acetylglucosaminidase [Staphylococcus delphini]PCF84061.1 autolysin [Staphylococcus delphini]QUM67485.1 N-acetylglucosaminidase [Staphylococcus delphini]QUM69930.1 N-acetylglucosaminidase [Staphylococcus delphini]